MPLVSSSSSDADKIPYRPCAGIVLVNASGLVFAGRRLGSSRDALDVWQMPQGGIDEGESPDVAALREMEEEIGTRAATQIGEAADWLTYDLPPELLGKVWKGRYRGQIQKWFAFSFDGTDADINIETDDPEFAEWQWMKASDLVQRTVEFKRDVYAKVFEEFSEFLA